MDRQEHSQGRRAGSDRLSPKFSFRMPQRKPAPTETKPTADAEQGSDTPAKPEEKKSIRNFRQWAGFDKITLTIVFTDIVNSTALGYKLGNERMDQVRRAHFKRARNLIEKHDGYEIKTNGDEFMVAFHTVEDALDFALSLHADTGDQRIGIRAGIHVGPVIVEEQDAQGAAVSYTARVMGMAVNGGVWLSNEAKNHVDQEKAQRHESLQFEAHHDCTLKGFPGQHFLWSVEGTG